MQSVIETLTVVSKFTSDYSGLTTFGSISNNNSIATSPGGEAAMQFVTSSYSVIITGV